MTAPLTFLGDNSEFRGGQVATLGHWLVIYKNNKPISLYGTGVKVRKFTRAPAIGATVSTLVTEPQDLAHEVRSIVTQDGYTVPVVTVRLQVRLTPEEPAAAEILLRGIELYGARFFESTEADIRRRIEQHVRVRLRSVPAKILLEDGPAQVLFPTNAFTLPQPEVEVTSLQGVEWEEGTLAREVRDARERDVADREREQLDRDARERAAEAELHQQGISRRLVFAQQDTDAELSRRQLDAALDRAGRLGLDPVAIAEPDVWRQVSQQHSELLSKLFESQHLYPMLRTSPDLMRAIITRLDGKQPSGPLARQAEMVLDGVDPERVMRVDNVDVFSARDSIEYLNRGKLIVDPVIGETWIRAGGGGDLRGAGFALVPGRRAALVLLLAVPEPAVPVAFTDLIKAALPGTPLNVGVRGAVGETLIDAVTGFAKQIAPAAQVSLVLRQSKGQREVLVGLDGPTEATNAVFRTVTDPENPILPALESLIGNRARIRFTRSAV